MVTIGYITYKFIELLSGVNYSGARDAGEVFLRAEQAGLRLAIIGRTVALVLLGIWLVGTRARDPGRALDYLLLLSVFAGLGLAHYWLIGTRFDKRWVKYAFITLDIAIISALVATQPLFESAAGLPQVAGSDRRAGQEGRARP